MHSEKIAVPLSEELLSEIRHLSQSEKNHLFYKMVQQYLERKKSEQLIQELKHGYQEMAELNLLISQAFAYCEWEVSHKKDVQSGVTHY